ncbi:PREDICTED: probable disease resistance protein At4g27220 [Populus euphratica]|uniref:Probable disease resistance protein At4g27220 n=1 Tax=Populus euphratica TaxID=75702 RepID=A0AAJ6TFT8_POPEU|nr:PREDICTED: probable disease resistance protein At4g27220 [Populus euphratica]
MAIESVGGSIISKIAELMVEPVGRQFRYMFCFNNFVEEFKEQKENLALALDGLQKEVEAAERNAEEIYEDVKKWMEDAKNEIEGAKPLENEIGKNGKCFTWCPNCMRQFKLSKALAKRSEIFRELLEKKFTKVSHRAHPQPIEFLPSKEFTPSESSEEAFKLIMKALKDDNVNMIGLYGMGGVGKTTLVKEVGRRAKESQLFPEVLMATVSQNPNVMGIQDRMADSLHLKFEKKSKEGKASELWQRLQGKKMLIILDDVWKHIDLKEIGIPFGDDHRGCKILLTTRVQGICSSMGCQQKVLLRVLPEDEAWDLFRINAGLRDGDSTLNKVAREVARECQGLPIALVTVGRALRDKSLDQWELASRELKESQFGRMEQIDEQNNAYTCLKLSYDYLKYAETKSCFVLCCLFPEDCDIPIEELTRYAVGYGLHQDAEPIEDARKRVSVAIENLKDCCMLLGSETEEHVRMHDLVRDFAIQIASSEEYGFMVKAGIGLKKWPMSNTSFEGCKTISLMGNKLEELPERLGCPQLKVLLLEVDDGMNVPERFFEGMKEIEVLSLEGGCLSLQSLELSTKLQSLELMECECKDLIWLRKLQRLKILGLMGCSSIEELPDEIGELKELRLLDVRGCERLRRIPVNLIGRLKKLEELLIGGRSFDGWDVVGCDSTGGMNASLTELNSLSQLAVLSLRIPKVECIPRDFVFPDSLRKYGIILANAKEYYTMFRDRYPTTLILFGTSLNAKIFEQLFLRKLESVEVRDCADVSTLFPARLRQGLKNLKEVIVDSCESLEEVFELGDLPGEGSSEEKELLSSLTTLELGRLPELKCIWKGPTRHVSLQNLARLDLYSLDKLTFIFTPSLARSLPKLETLDISDCGELKHIIREEDGERETITGSPCFPELKNIDISFCDKLEYVFPVSLSHNRDGIVKFPQLRKLSLRLRSNYSFLGPRNFDAQLPLRKLTIEGHEEVGNWLAQLQMAVHGQQNGFLQRLEYVKADGCRDVRAPFPAKLLRAVNNLSTVEITGCESLEEVFELDEADEGSSEEKELPLLSSLTKLQVRRLPELKCIWKGPTRHVSLQNLARLDLDSLNKLTFIFTPSLARSLPKLGTLDIRDCGELKHIIREEDGEREIITESPCFPQLKKITIEKCGKLEYVFPVSVSPSLLNLEEMQIVKAHNLKQIFYSGEGDALTTDGIIKFPRLSELDLSFRSNCSFFGPNNFAAQLPSLQTLQINGHKDVGNLRAQLQGLTNLETLCLQSLPDTRCIWKGTLEMAVHGQQNGFLQRLESVRLSNCGDVRAPFPAKLLPDLNNLSTVEITGCKSLEELFELGEADEGSTEEKELPLLSSLTKLQVRRLPELKCIWKGPNRHVSLHNLIFLHLHSLNKLTFIFTPSLARSLLKLERLEISECGELKHIIREEDGEREIIPVSPGLDDQASPINVEKKIVLPNLKKLSLKQLSSIVCFSFGWCDYFLFPRLEKLKVHQCPKLTTKFATTPDGSMSAQSEVSEDSSINREWTRNNGWKEVQEEEEEMMIASLIILSRPNQARVVSCYMISRLVLRICSRLVGSN